MSAASDFGFDQNKTSCTYEAPRPRHEHDRAHDGIVARLMRPGTVLAIVLLLIALAVASIVFVIQLLSVT